MAIILKIHIFKSLPWMQNKNNLPMENNFMTLVLQIKFIFSIGQEPYPPPPHTQNKPCLLQVKLSVKNMLEKII